MVVKLNCFYRGVILSGREEVLEVICNFYKRHPRAFILGLFHKYLGWQGLPVSSSFFFFSDFFFFIQNLQFIFSVHSACCTFYGFTKMHSDIYALIQYHMEQFQYPKNSLKIFRIYVLLLTI